MKSRPVIYSFANGRGIVRVPIGRDSKREAVLFKEDYQDLISLGLSGNWFAIDNSVCARIPGGKTILVARAIINARPGQIVRYLDGNGLNLRYENLRLVNGGFSVNADRSLLLEGRRKNACEDTKHGCDGSCGTGL